MSILRRLIILSHRYLGIVLSLLVIMWFATGITMMYVGGMPRLTPETRLQRMPVLELDRVKLSPAEAEERAGGPGRTQLLMVMGRPAYRVGGTTVFADDGEVLDEVNRRQARTIVSRFAGVPDDKVEYVRTVTTADQWTLGQDRLLPLMKFRVEDEAGSEVYVQPRTGEVAMYTTRQARGLAWISTIPHWLYFVGLRENQPLWYRLVVWTSGAACVLSLLGLALTFTQWRKTRPFKLSKAIPYSGWMRWHYITGAVFGVFTLTWAYSGLLSMEPFEWTNAEGLRVQRDVFTGGPADMTEFASMDTATWHRVLGGRGIKEVDFVRIQDEPYYVVRQAADSAADAKKRERLHQPYNIAGRTEQDRVLVSAKTLAIRREPFSEASLVARLEASLPDVPIVDSQTLTEYDDYYYSRYGQQPLPVVRVKFADAGDTWLYIEPQMNQVVLSLHRLNRVERWLYNGLHSLDFAFWYNRRPLWDIGVIALCLGGLTTSVLGLMMGVRRMRRAGARAVKAIAPQSGESARPSTSAAALRATE
jgi:uncharacterized iron-regulated membrane protein